MKGALSDPESVLYDTLSAALFPGTTYRFESGGTPEAIPTLTYEEFLHTHSRHYHPSNSYIVLYGDMDLEPFLRQIDGYLCGAMEGTAAPNPIGLQSPVVAEGVRKSMAIAPENSCAALGFVAGRSDERERMIAVSVLLDAIMGSNEAPLKRALLDADLADDCDGYLADSMLQPFVAITARGLHGDRAADRLREVVARTAADLASGGLDLGLVEAALSHAEFVMREGSFGYADGVVLSMSAMNGWLYDDDPASATACIPRRGRLRVAAREAVRRLLPPPAARAAGRLRPSRTGGGRAGRHRRGGGRACQAQGAREGHVALRAAGRRRRGCGVAGGPDNP